jgi:hypothetical protein
LNWNDFQSRADALVKLEFHAIFLSIIGVVLSLTGHHEEGLMVLGGAMALFKSHPNS